MFLYEFLQENFLDTLSLEREGNLVTSQGVKSKEELNNEARSHKQPRENPGLALPTGLQ